MLTQIYQSLEERSCHFSKTGAIDRRWEDMVLYCQPAVECTWEFTLIALPNSAFLTQNSLKEIWHWISTCLYYKFSTWNAISVSCLAELVTLEPKDHNNKIIWSTHLSNHRISLMHAVTGPEQKVTHGAFIQAGKNIIWVGSICPVFSFVKQKDNSRVFLS